MNLKPYPKYKDSGIEWIGEIPEGWEVRKLGYHAEMTVPMRDKPPVFDGDIPWIRIEDFDGKYIYDSKSDQRVSKKIIRSMNLKVYPVGTVLCSCSCNMGATAIVSSPLISNQTFIGIVPRSNISSEFLYYLMNASSERLQYLGSGAIQQYLSKENFKNLKLALPPLQDQTAIANFLDQKTAKIDELIMKNEKLSELLKEKRQAIISHAVTKGIPPHPPLEKGGWGDLKMRDSGIKWLGEIPEGWDVRRLKFIALVRPSNVDKKTEGGETEVRLCNYIDVYNNEFIDDSIDFMVASATFDEIKKFRILRGDVLITKDSEEWDDIAVPSFIKEILETVLCGYHLALVRPKAGMIDGKYLFRTFQSYIVNSQFRISVNGITRYGLSRNSIASAFFPVPPLLEQQAIANFLDHKTAKIDESIKNIKSQIEKLKEYRQTLISNVVTGKVRVN